MSKEIKKSQSAILSATSQITAELGTIFAKCLATYTVEVMAMLHDRGLLERATEPNESVGLPASVRELLDEAKRDDALMVDENVARARVARNKLALAMKNRGLNQAQLAKRLGKSPTVISRIFRNPERSKISTLREIATALNVELSGILITNSA